ncbi:MAG TPA: tetratricopeptide repeat protein, partial [Verrucomicrobiae bacterium]|nr:tetratricopeptide repeat protein [Verrucomicrobiae bacterium]
SEFSLLTMRAAWAPPLLAVLVCGLQMTFWEHAVAWTGEMLDLLVFAYVIRCLLEFRISQRESWIIRCAIAYGLGMANNWAMIGFFPIFLGALIWIKGLAFFNPRALLRTLGCGLLGLSLIFLLPLLVSFANLPHFGFWDALRSALALDKSYLFNIPRELFFLLALTSLLPVIVISIRWASYFGDTSPLGIFIATSTLHVVHALFLLACIWVAMDAPVSPRHNSIFGVTFLSFYYLGAVSIGYFAGYFLLIFGTKVPSSRDRPHPLTKSANLCVTALMWLLSIAAPVILVAKNLPDIRAHHATVFAFDKYISRMEQSLPPQGAVVLSDDPDRLHYLQATMNQNGDKRDCLFVDTGSMGQYKYYLHFLAVKYPQFNLADAATNILSGTNALVGAPDSLELIKLYDKLAKTHELCYLHPSFGSIFEKFHLVPEGLVYQMQPYGSNVWMNPLPDRELIAKNQEIWKQAVADDDVQVLLRTIAAPEHHTDSQLLKRFITRTHLTSEPDKLAQSLGIYYSRALDYWGVELQRCGLYPDAEKCFEQSQLFNPENVSARVNLECNQVLRSGKKPALHQIKGIEDKFGKRRDWEQILNADGPFDEPSYCFELGTTLAKGANFRQAIQQYDRARTLSPDSLVPPLELSQLFISLQQSPTEAIALLPYTQGYSNAVVAADQALQIMPTNVNALFFKSVALMNLGSYDKALTPLNDLISEQTNNYIVILNRAVSYLQLSNLDAARRDYQTVSKVAPKAYQVYYGLGEIAYRQKDTAAAIKYYELYLANPPANSKEPRYMEEAKFIRTRLKELKTGAP